MTCGNEYCDVALGDPCLMHVSLHPIGNGPSSRLVRDKHEGKKKEKKKEGKRFPARCPKERQVQMIEVARGPRSVTPVSGHRPPITTTWRDVRYCLSLGPSPRGISNPPTRAARQCMNIE
jgi:hypothetical protein